MVFYVTTTNKNYWEKAIGFDLFVAVIQDCFKKSLTRG
jgi:hypothetical protein